jgi:hypothetical protein
VNARGNEASPVSLESQIQAPSPSEENARGNEASPVSPESQNQAPLSEEKVQVETVEIDVPASQMQAPSPSEENARVEVGRPASLEPREQAPSPSEKDGQVEVAQPASLEPREQAPSPSEENARVEVGRLVLPDSQIQKSLALLDSTGDNPLQIEKLSKTDTLAQTNAIISPNEVESSAKTVGTVIAEEAKQKILEGEEEAKQKILEEENIKNNLEDTKAAAVEANNEIQTTKAVVVETNNEILNLSTKLDILTVMMNDLAKKQEEGIQQEVNQQNVNQLGVDQQRDTRLDVNQLGVDQRRDTQQEVIQRRVDQPDVSPRGDTRLDVNQLDVNQRGINQQNVNQLGVDQRGDTRQNVNQLGVDQRRDTRQEVNQLGVDQRSPINQMGNQQSMMINHPELSERPLSSFTDSSFVRKESPLPNGTTFPPSEEFNRNTQVNEGNLKNMKGAEKSESSSFLGENVEDFASGQKSESQQNPLVNKINSSKKAADGVSAQEPVINIDETSSFDDSGVEMNVKEVNAEGGALEEGGKSFDSESVNDSSKQPDTFPESNFLPVEEEEGKTSSSSSLATKDELDDSLDKDKVENPLTKNEAETIEAETVEPKTVKAKRNASAGINAQALKLPVENTGKSAELFIRELTRLRSLKNAASKFANINIGIQK